MLTDTEIKELKTLIKSTLIEFFTQKYVTMKQAAELLGVHPRTVRRWVDSGKLKTDNGKIPKEEIVKYM